MKRLLLMAALSSCAATHALQRHDRKAPLAAYVVDAVMFSAGTIIGMDAQYRNPQDRTKMVAGYSVALAFWLPYWFVETR